MRVRVGAEQRNELAHSVAQADVRAAYNDRMLSYRPRADARVSRWTDTGRPVVDAAATVRANVIAGRGEGAGALRGSGYE